MGSASQLEPAVASDAWGAEWGVADSSDADSSDDGPSS